MGAVRPKTKNAIVLPTASGKTVIFSEFISRSSDKSFLIIVHRDELVRQTANKLSQYGVSHGIEQASSTIGKRLLEKLTKKIESQKLRRLDLLNTKKEKIEQIKLEIEKLDEKLSRAERMNSRRDQEWIKDTRAKRIAWYESRVKSIEQIPLNKRKVFQSKNLELYKQSIIKTQQASDSEILNLKEKSTNRLIRGVKFRENIKLQRERAIKDLESKLSQPIPKLEAPSVVIATAQSLKESRLEYWSADSFDYVIWDEAHHLETAKTWKEIEQKFSNAIHFGFSATWKPKTFTTIYTKAISELIDAGWLARPIPIRYDLTDKMIHYTSARFTEVLFNFIKDVCSENKEEKIIVFVSSVGQSEKLAKQLESFGIKSKSLTIKTILSRQKRQSLIDDFKFGDLQVLCNYEILSEGFDAPDATMIIPRNTFNQNIYIQTVGRGLRISKTKKTVKVVDFITDYGQCSLASLFGMPNEYVFKNHDVLIDFSKFKKDPSAFLNPKDNRKPRGPDFNDVFGGSLIKVQDGYSKRRGNSYVKAVAFGGNNFYNPREALALAIKEKLQKELSIQPVKSIDPSTIIGKKPSSDLTHQEEQRFLAWHYIRKYKQSSRFLMDLFWKKKTNPRMGLSSKQCEVAIRIGKECSEFEKQNKATDILDIDIKT